MHLFPCLCRTNWMFCALYPMIHFMYTPLWMGRLARFLPELATWGTYPTRSQQTRTSPPQICDLHPSVRYFYFQNNGRDAHCKQLLRYVFARNNDDSVGSNIDGHQQQESQQPIMDDFLPPAPKTKKVGSRVVKITCEVLRGQKVLCAPSMSLLRIRPYEHFRTKLDEEGVLV